MCFMQQARFTLLPACCFQVWDQIPLEVLTHHNQTLRLLFHALTCDKPWECHVDPTTNEDHRQHVGYIPFHHVCQHGRICKSNTEHHVAGQTGDNTSTKVRCLKYKTEWELTVLPRYLPGSISFYCQSSNILQDEQLLWQQLLLKASFVFCCICPIPVCASLWGCLPKKVAVNNSANLLLMSLEPITSYAFRDGPAGAGAEKRQQDSHFWPYWEACLTRPRCWSDPTHCYLPSPLPSSLSSFPTSTLTFTELFAKVVLLATSAEKDIFSLPPVFTTP